MNKTYLSFALIFALSCNSTELLDTEQIAEADQPISFSIASTISRGKMVDAVGDMGTMGIYCAQTGNIGWSEGASFTKLENQLFNIASNGDCSIAGSEVAWEHNAITDKYSFFGYSPHSSISSAINARIDGGELYIDYKVPSSSLLQPDLMVATPKKDITPQLSKGVSLDFTHALSAVSFAVKTATDIKITAISIEGPYDEGTLNWLYGKGVHWEPKGSNETLFSVDMVTNYTLDENSSAQLTSDNGYLMMVPQTLANGAQVYLSLSDNTTRELTIPSSTVWVAGGHYHYTIQLEEESCDSIFSSSQISNCYIINPSEGEPTIVQIPIEERINDFWLNYAETKTTKITSDSQRDDFSIATVWEDFDTAVVFDEENLPKVIDDGTGSMAALFRFDAKYQEGNYVFAVMDSKKNVLWSWHLWFTSYNPDAIAKANRSKIISTQYEYSLDDFDGAVHRYEDSDGATVWADIYADKFIMDRNIGERNCYTSATAPGGVYYQFGRKDPFPSSTEPYNDAEFGLFYRNQTGRFYEEAVEAPQSFYYSNSSNANWCESLIARTPNTYIWYDEAQKVDGYFSGKSIFDPSPLGWRVPLNDVWSTLNGRISDCNNSDFINIINSYRPYGYRDSSSSTSLTNAGSRVYVWGATTLTDCRGYSLRFKGNNMSSTYEMYLSDALPVRAIEE